MAASPRIAIIDYGAGNLHSVTKAFEKIGHPATVTTSPQEIHSADAVVLPGVGAAGDSMTSLRARGMVEAIAATVSKNKPFFGVCLGLQLLFEQSEEGGAECLGILKGRVRLFQGETLKVPHMGWNQVVLERPSPLFAGIPNESNFYFVHSYYADPVDDSIVAGRTEYGQRFCSAIAKGNLVATQFHPEKSGPTGLRIYENFVRMAAG